MKRSASRGQPPAPLKKKRPAAGRAVLSKPGSGKASTLRAGAAPSRKASKSSAKAGSKSHLDTRETVRTALGDYATRGFFTGFAEGDAAGGKTVFRFTWLHDQQMELTLDPAKKLLLFDRMLPGVQPGTPFAAGLKQLIKSLTSDEVPEYRRVDPKRASLTCTNRQNHLSVAVGVKQNDYAYAVNRIINVAHEVFVYLRSDWPEYLMEYFNEPEE